MRKGMAEKFHRVNLADFNDFYNEVMLDVQNIMDFMPVVMLANRSITYNELVDGLFAIVTNTITQTTERKGKVDFSRDILPESVIIGSRKPKSL